METEIIEKMLFNPEQLYSRIGNCELSGHNIGLTVDGAKRFSSIAGYILALRHMGKEDVAESMEKDLNSNLLHLIRNGRTVDLEVVKDNVSQSVTVPMTKAVLYDDGCLHSFGFTSYYAVDPNTYTETFEFYSKEIEEENAKKYSESQNSYLTEEAHRRTAAKLEICEKPCAGFVLNEYRYIHNKTTTIYYRAGLCGGLIFHGPGSGETFSVLVSAEPRLWSIHT